jgi:environmental stress-induced protein Ves
MVIEGDGMDLTVGNAPARRLDRLFEPFVFSGDEPAECRLLGGPIRDFNLMVDRSQLRAQLDVFELDPARSVDLPAVPHCVVHCFDGSIELVGGGSGEPASSSEGGARVAATAAGSRARIAVIGLTPRRPAA